MKHYIVTENCVTIFNYKTYTAPQIKVGGYGYGQFIYTHQLACGALWAINQMEIRKFDFPIYV